MSNKVSVIIPVYNSEKFLRETIDSCLKQTWQNTEMIIVDDGSTDRSLSIAKKFSSENVKVYSQENRGACAARNLGVFNSTGDFIMFLDADDLMSPDKIEVQMEALGKQRGNFIAFCGWGRFYHDLTDFSAEKQAVNKDYEKPVHCLIDVWRGKGIVPISAWLVPRILIEKVGRWNEELLINQDGEFFTRVILQAEKLIFTEGLVYYRSGNKESISGSKVSYEKAHSLLKSYRLYQKHLKPEVCTAGIKEALGANFISFFYRFYDQYPELAEEAYDDFLNLKVSVTNGGRAFHLLTPFFGIKGALKVKSLLKRK